MPTHRKEDKDAGGASESEQGGAVPAAFQVSEASTTCAGKKWRGGSTEGR